MFLSFMWLSVIQIMFKNNFDWLTLKSLLVLLNYQLWHLKIVAKITSHFENVNPDLQYKYNINAIVTTEK